QAVTLTAAVASLDGTPTGAVTFLDGTTALATVPLDAGGQAVLTTSALSLGGHDLTARYGGDAVFAPATSFDLSQNVAFPAPAVRVTSDAGQASFAQRVTFTATVSSPAGTPTGAVTFLDGSSALATVPLDAAGHASFATAALAIGAHALTARYGGDAAFTVATSPSFDQEVAPAASSVLLTSDANPSRPGQSVTLTAAVSSL